MENSKSRKPRKIQMKYPAPYSQSWSHADQNIPGKMKKSTSFQGNNQCCWMRPKPIKEGCDPYAPHLKYGMFPRKVTRDTNNQMNKPMVENIHINKNLLTKDAKKMIQKAGQLSPILVVRAVDKLTRRLSSSGVTHVDIQPRRGINRSRYEDYRYHVNKF